MAIFNSFLYVYQRVIHGDGNVTRISGLILGFFPN